MYSSVDFKRLFIRYKSEKWNKSISHCAVKVKALETSLYTNL